MKPNDLIAVGRVVKSVGVVGEVKVEVFSGRAERFRSLKAVWIGHTEEEAEGTEVVEARRVGSSIVLRFKGVQERDGADALRGAFIFVDAAHAERPEEDSYFIHEIVGMAVETEDGRVVGTVTDVQHLPASDVWLVEAAGGREILIPAVQAIVRRVDREQRRIIINAIEGLLE